MSRNRAAQMSPKFRPENVTCVGTTGVERDSFSFLWTVEDYSFLKRSKELKSPVFQGSDASSHSWQLSVRHDVERISWPQKERYLTLALRLVDYGDRNDDNSARSSVPTQFQFSILDQKGLRAVRVVPKFPSSNSPDLFYLFTSKGETSCSYNLISERDFALKEKELVVNNSLKFLCEIWIHGEVKQRVGSGGPSRLHPSEAKMTKIRYESLVNDFGKMWKNSIGSDVTIETKHASFEAHKNILMARSSVFSAMFNTAMRENEESRVKITDFDDKVVEGMLEHLYIGQTDCMAERAKDLLKISEKYDLGGLKKDCEFMIASKLGKNNAAATLILAHTYNAPYLKQKAVDFINMHKEELLKSKFFVDAVKAHPDAGFLTELYFSQ